MHEDLRNGYFSCQPRHIQHLVPRQVRQFEALTAAAPADADLQVALGVLHNLSRDFGRAEAAFRAALALRPTDYSLWNKLGAHA